MRVLVTGGAGFIGANLCRSLERHRQVTEVRALDDLSSGTAANLDGTGARLHVGSVNDRTLLDELLDGVDAVVHLAARPSVARSIDDPIATHVANVDGTLQVLEAARTRPDPPHVVVASSSSVYGSNPALPKHEGLATAPMSPYAASKLATEAYALAYGESFGLPVLAFRFFNVFGPYQAVGHAYAAVIPAFVHAALHDQPLEVHGDGTQTRDFTYVDSVSGIIAEAVVRRTTSPGPVNLAFGTRLSLLEVISKLEKVLDRRVEVVHTDPRPGDVPHSQADGSRLQSLFPEAVPVPFPDALRATVDWYRTASS